MLAIGGLLLQSTLPVSVTYAQSLTIAGAATVSSLMMGFAWGMGSLAVPLIGLVGRPFRHQSRRCVGLVGRAAASRLRWRAAVARTRREGQPPVPAAS